MNKFIELFVEELSDMLNAEEQMIKALPHMVKASDSPELKEAFAVHLEETQGQYERLKKIFSILKLKPNSETCKAMEGLVKECKEIIDEFEPSPLRDAALIAKAQRIEHYEIAAYRTLCTYANELDLSECLPLLEETLQQEVHADKVLNKIAEGGLLEASL